MNALIITHRSDFDGLASGEVCRLGLELLRHQVTVLGWDYGDPTPNVEGYDQIYLTDIAVDALLERDDLRDKLVWIDHHKSSIEKHDGRGHRGFRVDGVAACRLCWQWFFPTDDLPVGEAACYRERRVREPHMLRLLGEHDVFDHHDPDTLLLQLGLKMFTTHETQGRIRRELQCFMDHGTFSPDLYEVIEDAMSIQAYVQQQNQRHASQHSYTVQIHGLLMCVLNTGSPGNSQLFADAPRPEHDALCAWRWDGKQFYVSFYHKPGREDLDLSVIAKQFGGGGHRGACGCRINAQDAIAMGLIR